ncbi:MAG: endonuclease/exonuclease/phosphatase family protein [Lysobacteraceae bacterium]
MGQRQLRILSCNIQAGSSTRRYRDYVTRGWSHVLPVGKDGSLGRIAELTRPYDIVGLQEADPGSLRSGFLNQTHYLAEHADFPYWTHQPNRSVGGIASSANGILSRIAPTDVLDYPLPGRIKGRGLLLARFGEGDGALAVAVAHLSLGVKSRQAQLAFIAELLSGLPHVVLMGDFNTTPDAPEMRALYRNTRLAPPDTVRATFPSWKPERAIDHILTSDPIRCSGHEALPAAHSDHLALAVELSVPHEAFGEAG